MQLPSMGYWLLTQFICWALDETSSNKEEVLIENMDYRLHNV